MNRCRPGHWSARVAIGMVAAALVVTATACGGDAPDADTIVLSNDMEYVPVIVSDEITVKDSRLSLALLDKDQVPVKDAQLHFAFYKIAGNKGLLYTETDAVPVTVLQSYTDRHPDGLIETHTSGEVSVYVANVKFDAPGDYGIQFSGKVAGKEMKPLQVRFNVLAEVPAVEPGERAPSTNQVTLRDVSDLREIDTSDPADPEMHRQTIAEAVTSGRPTVVIFSTPAFCTSRICGPVKQTLDRVYDKYKGQANFIHVEPYDVAKARSGQGLEPVPFLEQEWGLHSEPWVYVIARDGIVSSRFEAAVTEAEIEQALKLVLN